MATSILLESVRLAGGKGLALKNRVIMSPLTRGRAGNVEIMGNKHQIEYYTQRASAGLIITEATTVSEQGKGWSGAGTIYRPQDAEGWKKVTDSVHQKDGKIFLQLWHMGRVTNTHFHGIQPVAPSAIKVDRGKGYGYDQQLLDYELPRALETDEIPAIVEDYRKAAVLAKEAGFDGIQIHAANGYLVDQFLQSISNKRTDRYGGSIENRFRFLSEILDAVTTVWPSQQVAVRFSPNGVYNCMGSEDNYEAYSYYVSELEKRDLAFLEVLDGLAFGFHGKSKAFRLYDVRLAGYKGTLVGNCGYTKEKAEGALETGVADLITFGRLYLSNPDLVERFRNNWPLNPIPDHTTFYNYPAGHPEVGYSDYEAYKTTEEDKVRVS